VVKKTALLLFGLIGWQVYIYLTSLTGAYKNMSFPPPFFYMLIIPAFLFTGIFMFINKDKAWIEQIPESWLIYYQAFRVLVESLFVYSIAKNIVHENMTIAGYNYDMVFGASAIVVGLLVFQFKAVPKKFVLAWNYLGLCVIAVIIFIVNSTIYLPELYGADMAPWPADFGLYPYIVVAGFLMPSAVFVHVLSIVQLRRRLKTKKK